MEQGYVLIQSNDLEQAENYISIGIELTEKYFKDDFYRLRHAYNRASLYYAEKENGNKMIEYAQKSLRLYDAIPNEERYEEDYWEIANLYQNLGVGYVFLKNYLAAIKQYELANQINQQYIKERTPYLADNYSNLANIYRITKNYPKALKNIETAIAYDSQGKKKSSTGV
ncbi:MAG: tetratricopeptide repeat protein [Saprospiraceae bacterium]|nr:tetratricopeptide repeat protein [Saprospiraceae bacterium]